MVYVTDSASTDVTLSLFGGTHYSFTQPLVGLTISSVENSHYESEIVFTGGSTFNIAWPLSLDVIDDPAFESNTSYVINIRDNMMVASEYTPGVV